jgi:ATP-dependent Zn protease
MDAKPFSVCTLKKRRIPLGDDVNLHRLARLTPGSSGAELANLLNEAAIAAVREKQNNGELAALRGRA